MPQYITGKNETVRVAIENMLWACDAIKLIHDGGRTNSKIYTRKYDIMLEGKRTGRELKFVYDNREGIADIEITGYDLLELKTQQLLKGINNERIPLLESERNFKTRTGDEKVRDSRDLSESSRISSSIQKSQRQL